MAKPDGLQVNRWPTYIARFAPLVVITPVLVGGVVEAYNHGLEKFVEHFDLEKMSAWDMGVDASLALGVLAVVINAFLPNKDYFVARETTPQPVQSTTRGFR